MQHGCRNPDIDSSYGWFYLPGTIPFWKLIDHHSLSHLAQCRAPNGFQQCTAILHASQGPIPHIPTPALVNRRHHHLVVGSSKEAYTSNSMAENNVSLLLVTLKRNAHLGFHAAFHFNIFHTPTPTAFNVFHASALKWQVKSVKSVIRFSHLSLRRLMSIAQRPTTPIEIAPTSFW